MQGTNGNNSMAAASSLKTKLGSLEVSKFYTPSNHTRNKTIPGCYSLLARCVSLGARAFWVPFFSFITELSWRDGPISIECDNWSLK